MKKWMFVCFTVLFCGMLVLSASAAGTADLPDGHFATSEEMFQYWNSTYPPQYPDYVGGVWTDNGTSYPLTIALTDDAAGRTGKKELLRLIADDGSVKFTTVKYSYNRLWQIREEIMPYFEKDIGLVSLGVYDMENCVGIEMHQDEKNASATREFVRDLKQRYGDAVRITYTDSYVFMTDDIDVLKGEADISRDMGLWIASAIAIGFLGTAAVLLTYRRRRALAVQTSAETVVTVAVTRKPTRRALKRALRESEEAPSPSLEKKVMDRID